MEINKQDIIDLLNKHDGGKYSEHYGPTYYSEWKIWEIWVNKDGIYETRFVSQRKNESFQYFNDFQALCSQMNAWFQSSINQNSCMNPGSSAIQNSANNKQSNPSEMTIGEFIQKMRPAQLWGLLVALATAFIAIVSIAFRLGAGKF